MSTLATIFQGPITWAAVIALLGLAVWQVSRGLLVSRINRWIDGRLQAGLFVTGRYKSSLKEKLMEMPFLYRDMRLNAKDDYVEMTISTADSQVAPLGNPTIDYRTPLLRFRQSRRGLLFGDGGFGKTTLFRHVILRLLDGDKSTNPFDRRSIPIFVALKAVKLSSEFPVFDCIQSSSPLFSGAAGYRRLQKLARQRRLVIFLDGYDEMPYAGGVSHVVSEIETFFGKHDRSRPTFFEAKKDFYILAQSCRVYLSSRREFFFHNRFSVSADVPRWLVRGLGDRRADLVDRIFSRYKDGSSFLSERLDQELFLQQLAESCDSQLVDLSYSPLFLTVMCYIYVDSIKEKALDGRVVFTNGAHGLIKRCIGLLISDVDEYKARGLSDAQRSALINRRASYPAEKMAFLQFFAARLYEGDVGVFDRVVLIELACCFFESRVDRDSQVRKGLNGDDPTMNIIDQLIFSGLFVVVDFRKDVKIYDFPHRSFREALAVDYYTCESTLGTLLDNFDRPSYGELALIYVEQSRFGERILDNILEKLRLGLYDKKHGEFLLDALRRVGKEVREKVVLEFIDLLSKRSDARAPCGLVSYLPDHDVYRDLVLSKLSDVAAKGDACGVGFWFTIIILKGFSGVDNRLVAIINSLSLVSIRECMYSPVGLSIMVRRALIIKLLSLSGDRSSIERALFDIYRCFFIGKNTSDRGFVHSIIDSESEVLCRNLRCSRESLIVSVDFSFGGVSLPEGRKSLIYPMETGLPPPQSQLYST